MTTSTLETFFVQAMRQHLPTGAGDTAARAADPYVRRGVTLNDRGRLLQLYPLADRAWTRWVSTAVRANGLPDLADVIARQGVVDQASAALSADLWRAAIVPR